MRIPARSVASATAAAALFSTLGCSAALAQGGDRTWRSQVVVQSEFRYDDNPFLLTSGQKRGLDQISFEDSQSGQFRDMPSARDMIAVPSLDLEIAGPGLFGRRLELEVEAALQANFQNDNRRHAEVSLDLRQSASKAGRLRLGADWRPSYFHKNYLADAVDVNGDGDIDRVERRYAPGTSDEVEVLLGYRHRLVNAKKSRPFGLSGELEAGYFRRDYGAPFAGRSRKGPGATARLTAELGKRWVVGLGYAYARENATPTREVLILNENQFGQDFNSNGSFSDDSARAFELVDRSRTEQTVELTFESELSDAVTAQLAYARRRRDFSSTEPFDVGNRGREDTRHEIVVEVEVRLARGLRLALGGQVAQQDTNRAGDPSSTGDVTDYTRRVAVAGLRYRL